MFRSFCRYFLAAFLVSSAATDANAQKAKPRPAPANIYQAVDTKMRQVPDSAARTVAGLARYINASFSTEADKARAAFVWVAKHIRYDVANRYTVVFQREPAVVVQETLASRKGVCTNYAELYAAIANQVGVPTYVVTGYNSLRESVGHAWCASRLSGQWVLLDPTWAAGKVTANGQFIFQLNEDYYKVAPAVFIQSHMPFDPLWQLLKAPRTPEQFQLGITPRTPSPAFAFADSVAEFGRQTPLQQLRATSRRIEKNGVKSDLIFSHLIRTRQAEENYRADLHNQQLAAHNKAIELFNQGNGKLNEFLEFFNKQFLPKKTDEQLRLMLPPVADDFARARALLATVHLTDPNYQASAAEVEKLFRQAEINLKKAQAFMDRYLRTGKLLRPTLFLAVSNPEPAQ